MKIWYVIVLESRLFLSQGFFNNRLLKGFVNNMPIATGGSERGCYQMNEPRPNMAITFGCVISSSR